MANVAEQLVRRFKEQGIRYVFGVPSGSWLYYMEAMRKEGVEFVLVSNEASAGFMAYPESATALSDREPPI
jgi:acetolactate synthase-1/2/3 large subunit